MTTREVSFAIQGMREACAKCAVQIERALARLDGVTAANVNYAAERATIVHDPKRVTAAAMVRAVQGEGFDVPLERIVFSVGDLMYASSARTVDRVLGRLENVAQVTSDLANGRITLDVFRSAPREDYARAINELGLTVVERLSPNAAREFIIRTILAGAFAVTSLLSAGAHTGIFDVGVLHAPLALMAISAIAAYGIGWRFYRVAYDALLRREFDVSVLIAIIASASLFVCLPLAIIAPASWLTGIGFVLATHVTAGWFLARSASVWLMPRLNNGLGSVQPSGQLGVISRGIRH